jgi:hypothetical protein
MDLVVQLSSRLPRGSEKNGTVGAETDILPSIGGIFMPESILSRHMTYPNPDTP